MNSNFTPFPRRLSLLLKAMVCCAFLISSGSSFGQSYCTPTINNHCCGMGAAKVELDNGNAFSQSTTFNNSKYYFDYYNSVSGCVAPGGSYNLDVTVGPTYQHAVCIWIDWNKDGVFDNATSSNEKIDSVRSKQPNTVFSTTIDVPSGLASGSYRMRILTDYYYYYSNSGAIFDPCNAGGTWTYGDFQDYQLFVPSSNIDIKMVSIPQPATLTTGNNNVSVTLKNLSTVTIDSFRVSYQLNNGNIVTENVVQSLSTCGTYTYQFNTALNIASTGTYTLKTWVKYPNGTNPDNDATNDSASRTVCTGLSGNYTIDPGQAAGGTNYTSFTAAANALNICGITGPVTFTVAAGTYNESIKISKVNGHSSTNTITIDGVDNSNRKITSNAAYTIQLDGMEYVTIKNLTIDNTQTSTNAISLQLKNKSNFNYFDSLVVSMYNYNYSGTAYGIMDGNPYTYGDFGNNNIMQNSTLKGGYYTSVEVGSSSTKRSHGNQIHHCYIDNTTGYGAYFYYADTVAFHHNDVKDNYTYFYYVSNSDITNNYFMNNGYGYPIYSFYCTNFNIINNSLSGSNMYYGFYCYGLQSSNIWFNSVYSGYASAYGGYLQQGSNIDMRNNHFWVTGTSAVGFYASGTGIFSSCEYNNYYAPNGTNLAYFGTGYGNIQALKGQGGINNVAFNQQPNYSNTSSTPYDLHLTSTVQALTGDGTTGITTDIDGDSRCSIAPSLGCDESTFPVTTPVSGFTSPDTVYVNSPFTALNVAGPLDGKIFDWGVDGSYGVANTLNFKYTFTSSGAHTLSLITTNCSGSDTFTKTITVVAPTSKPTADFISDQNIIEANDIVKFSNLSAGGDTAWEWTCNTGTQGTDWDFATGAANDYEVDMVFMTAGKFEICLQAWNSQGTDKICKTAYIEVVPTVNMCASQLVTDPAGRFYDDGGRSSNYANSNNCNMVIDPCASTLTMTFKKFNVYLYGNCYLKIWDGKDKVTGKPFHTGQGWTGTNGPGTLVAKSGKMYIEWTSNYNYQTPGWEAEWTSTKGNFQTPSAQFTVPSTIYAGGTANLTAKNYDPNANYEWFVGGTSQGNGNQLQYLFAAAGQYDVCLVAYSCGGADTVCKNINVINPTAVPTVDFKIDYINNTNACYTAATNKVRVNVGDTITLIDLSTQGPNSWNWSGSPSNHMIFVGNPSDQNTQVTFDSAGTYDISLDATNALGTGSATKSGLVEVGGGYCKPGVSTLVADIGINSVDLGQISNITGSGIVAYSDYSNSVSTCLSRGGKYPFTIGRNSSLNPVNRKIWIDLNQDGQFDATEVVASQSKTNSQNWSDSLMIPVTSKLGRTGLRVGVSFSGQSNSPCGTNQFGEYEDYAVFIAPDVAGPVITLIGKNPDMVERGKSYTDPGATAWDAVDGNIVPTVSGIPGSTISIDTFYVTYNAVDQAGNQAVPVKRMVVVSDDKTGPVITLNGGAQYYVEVNNAFNDPLATAYDSVYGPINASSISITGSVNTSVLGVYTLTYTACDIKGNCSNVKRTVTVGDTTKPVLTMAGNNPMNVTVGGSFNDPGIASISDNYWNNLTSTSNTNLNLNVVGSYTVTYSATDGSGNTGTVNRTVNVVDDVKPTITLIGGDTVYVEAVKGLVWKDPGFYGTDNYYPSLTWNNTGSVVIDKTTLNQTQTLTYSATDGSGNNTVKTRVVIVRKTTKPWITLLGNYVDVVSWGAAGSTYTDAGVTKNDLFFDAADLTLSTFGTVDMTTPGIYTLKYIVTDPKNNVSDTAIRVVQVAVRNGISSVSNDVEVSLYPNPANGVFQVQIAGEAKFNGLCITNAMGQLVFTSQNIFTAGVHQIDLSNQAAGVYFVTLFNQNEVVVKKVNLITK